MELRADNSKASLPSDFFAERYFKVQKRLSKEFSHARRKAKNVFHAKIDRGSKRFVWHFPDGHRPQSGLRVRRMSLAARGVPMQSPPFPPPH